VKNRQTKIARHYHEETKHSLSRLQSNRHQLDWQNEPLPFKVYLDIEPIPLPEELPSSGKTVFEVLAGIREHSDSKTLASLDELAYLLYYTAGITKQMDLQGGRRLYFRAPPSAGALYPVEVYVVCKELPGLKAGVYHFNPADFSLRQLREGDYRQYLYQASGEDPALSDAPAVLIFTGITWRTAWKYQARSYRYHYWDCGVMLANALCVSGANDLPAKVVMGFIDDRVDDLIGIDGNQEKSLCLLPVGQDSDSLHQSNEPKYYSQSVPPLDLDILPISSSQLEYEVIQTLHNSSKLQSLEEVKAWKQPLSFTWKAEDGVNLEPLSTDRIPFRSIEEVIIKRGSSRRFTRDAFSFQEFSTILSLASQSLPTDWLDGRNDPLNRMYLSVHAVDELEMGAYVFHSQQMTLHGLKKGNFRGDSATICLGQELGGDASAAVYFLTDMESVLAHYGNRGYRAVQMEAGITGGLLYLGAYALKKGASGLTFFDDMMVDFFHPHGADLDAVFAVVLGEPDKNSGMGGRIRRVHPGEKVSL
jgi:SagB-type dehydrogenase family enzyme